ncbi:MAG: EamA family transporter [Bacteroidales bacterium]|nr:EamA family transporter [Bacteroidales bacterium]
MWIILAASSSFLLGLYDAAKKQALRKNGILAVLLVATALSTLFVSPFLRFGPAADHLKLLFKAVLVTSSWVSGMVGLKLLPLTTVSTIKGSRPLFVVLFSIILFGERLSLLQWAGVLIVLGALFLLGHTSKGDAPVQVRKTGFLWMGISVITGVVSALYDKHIMQGMEPMFVQSWTNLYITVLLALCVAVRRRKESGPIFRWDWWVLVVALLITGADACYFFALKQEDALLSVVSVIRRAAIIITFLCGAIFFKEGNLKAKSFNIILMAAGVALLLIGK